MFLESLNRESSSLLSFFCVGRVTRSYDLAVGTFDVFWDLFQVLFSGFISGSEGWGVQVRESN